MLNIKVVNVTGVQNRLKTMVSKDKLEQALDKSAFLVEHDAKRLVRVDTGRLRTSIDIIKKPLERRIGSSVQYAPAQEFGRPDMKGYGFTPYLRPAIRKNRGKIDSLIKEALQS